MPHYTSTSQESFIEKVTADFIGQIAQQLERSHTSQAELAQRLGVTESEVSQVLNLNRVNLNLKTIARYARALGMKVAVVAYDDGDPTNERGPVGANIFSLAWEKNGRPRDIWSVNENVAANAATRSLAMSPSLSTVVWRQAWVNSTLESWQFGTLTGLPANFIPHNVMTEANTYART